MKEYQEGGKIVIKFVKSEYNDADINTKNTANIDVLRVILFHQMKKFINCKVTCKQTSLGKTKRVSSECPSKSSKRSQDQEFFNILKFGLACAYTCQMLTEYCPSQRGEQFKAPC